MNSLDHFKKTYFEECAELLDALYAHLGDLAEGRADDETMHAIFRAVHSIKGGGGAFGFARLVAFAHILETLLDLLRSGRRCVDPEIGALLLRGTDTLADLIEGAKSDREPAANFEIEVAAMLQEAARSDGNLSAVIVPPTAHADVFRNDSLRRFAIRFVPHSEMFQRANEPLLLIRALKRLGEVSVRADLGRLPSFAAIEPEHAYISWNIGIETSAPRADIEEIFDFVTDDCDLTIEEEPSTGTEAAKVEPSLAMVSGQAEDTKAEPVRGAAPPRNETVSAAHSIRVDVEKVDRVVNLVGELVINQAVLTRLGQEIPPDLCPALLGGIETLSQQLRELQESVMSMRAQPVKSVFSRMPRLLRELAGRLGKEVRLVVTGEGTEIDKTVIEQLADPLTHLLRNAVDHGIEMPEDRVAQGKPAHGTIHLGAGHRSGRIVIEISDDGRGIDRERVLATARERGLVGPAAVLSDEEIDNLIFVPGFSTASKLSDISGRGVGMDVVRRNIQALGGRITVESRRGSGSRFVLSLPLTLAVLDGMVVAVGAESYIVPLTSIVESLRPKAADIHAIVGRGDVLSIRGEYVPLVYLHRRFAVDNAVTNPSEGIVVIVESDGEQRIGIVVDELVGQQQVVVKSLEANYDAVDGVSGATILGTGRVALILDLARLVAAPLSPQPTRPQTASAVARAASDLH